MKKISLSLAILLSSSNLIFANSEIKNSDEKKEKDSTEVVRESTFVANYQEQEKKLKIEINGNIDSLASVSVTNQRGSSILFSIIDQKSQDLVFDLSNFEKGIYNVMYITNSEIRIKKVIVK